MVVCSTTLHHQYRNASGSMQYYTAPPVLVDVGGVAVFVCIYVCILRCAYKYISCNGNDRRSVY